MAKDKKLDALLKDAHSVEAQERTALFDLLSRGFKVEVAGVDVTRMPAPPELEAELLRAKRRKAGPKR